MCHTVPPVISPQHIRYHPILGFQLNLAGTVENGVVGQTLPPVPFLMLEVVKKQGLSKIYI